MGIRFNTRLTDHTSASVSLGGLLVGVFAGVVALCMVAGAVVSIGWPAAIAGGLFAFVVVPGMVLLERYNRKR